MEQYRKNLGKVVMTPEGAWDINKEFESLSIVYDKHTLHAYVSKMNVPKGVDISNSEYWMPLNVSGYSDSNIIVLNELTEDGQLKSYTLEEAINTIADVAKRPGCVLSFYNNNTSRLDIGGCWEIWQYIGTTIYDWNNLSSWQNIYYNYNKFVGWYKSDELLKKYNPFPDVGCYAYVGNKLNDSTIYRCDVIHEWIDTTIKATDYIQLNVVGTTHVGANGNWYNGDEDTGIPASVKGENGKTPFIRNNNNVLEYSYDQVNWVAMSDKFTSNIYIKGYVDTVSQLPINQPVGTVYGVKDSTYTTEDPVYRIYVYTSLGWVDNGIFKGFSAGVVQKLGDSETEVISQKGVSDTTRNITKKIDNINVAIQTNLIRIDYIDDAFININGISANINTPTPSSFWRYALVPCVEGDEFTISGRTTSNDVAAIYAFVDSSYQIILRGNSKDTQYDNIYVIAPPNSAYLLLNDNKSNCLSFKGKALREDVREVTEKIEKIIPIVNKTNTLSLQNNITIVSSLKSESYYGDLGVEDWINVDSQTAKTAVIPVNKGDIISIKTNPNIATLLGFLSEFDTPKEGAIINYVENRIILQEEGYHPEPYEYVVGENIKYVAIRIFADNKDCTPISFIINGYDYVRKSILDTIDELSVKIDTNYNNFYIPLLHYGAYIGTDGLIYTNLNPPHRGTIKIRVNENEIYQFTNEANYYLLYDLSGNPITSLKPLTNGKTISIPANAAYMVLNVTPSKEDDFIFVQRRNNTPIIDLELLPTGSYWGSDGNLLEGVDNPVWRGSKKIKVQSNQFLKVKLAKFYILYDAEGVALTGLKSIPDNYIIKIPSNAVYIAFDIPYTVEYDFIPIEIFIGSDVDNMQWRGKKWVAFGCSISDTGDADNGNTATGKYAQYLVERSGLIHHNWAWGGSTLSNRDLSNADGIHPTYIQRIDQAISEGVLENADLITIDGLYNDFGQSYQLGEKTDMVDGKNNDSTIYMSLYQAITKLSIAAPNAKIVLLSDNTGQEYNNTDYSSYNIVNRIGLQQFDYHNAMRIYANYIGVTYIDSGSKSQINNLHPQYLADHIHQSDLGGKVFADVIWAELKNMNPSS